MRGYANNTDWGQIHFRSAGTGGEALVLLHESPYSSAIFDRALPLLGAHIRAWAMDTPGYGLSDPPPGPAEIQDYARVLLQAFDDIGLDRFAVFGSHTGASIAVEVATQAGPDRVTRLILCGVPLLTEPERKEFPKKYAPDLELRADGSHVRQTWEHFRRYMGPDTPLDLLTLSVAQVLGNHDRYHWAYRAAFRYDPAPALKRLGCPVLFLNTQDDPLASADERALQLVEDGSLSIIPGQNRKPYLRAPELFSQAVLAFLDGDADTGQGT